MRIHNLCDLLHGHFKLVFIINFSLIAVVDSHKCYFTAFIYPVLTHWGWTENGWMAKGITSGIIDTKYDVCFCFLLN